MSQTSKSSVLPCVPSSSILGDKKQVFISHTGQVYVLRVTSSDKLILTK